MICINARNVKYYYLDKKLPNRWKIVYYYREEDKHINLLMQNHYDKNDNSAEMSLMNEAE